MLDQLDIIGKTSEFARVFGIEFYDVLSRGSQVCLNFVKIGERYVCEGSDRNVLKCVKKLMVNPHLVVFDHFGKMSGKM